jgi:hypothetical protein
MVRLASMLIGLKSQFWRITTPIKSARRTIPFHYSRTPSPLDTSNLAGVGLLYTFRFSLNPLIVMEITEITGATDTEFTDRLAAL